MATRVPCPSSVTDRTTRRKAGSARGRGSRAALRSAWITSCVRAAAHALACATLVWTATLNVAGCGARPDASPNDEGTEPALTAQPGRAQLEHADALLAEAEAQLARAEPATRAPAAAAAAIEVARLGGPSRYLSRARDLLERASRGQGVHACESALALARLSSTLLRDLGAAQRVAERGAHAHEGDAPSASCARELRRIAVVLGEHRAPASSHETLVPGEHRAPALHETNATLDDDAIVEFADARGEPAERAGGGALLEDIAVYGRAPSGEPGGAEARVVLRFDGVAIYRRGELPPEPGAPRRLFLDLDGARIGPRVERRIEVGAAGLARVSVAARDQGDDQTDGQTRVTFDIGPTTAHRLFFLSDPYRVVMDFRDAAARAAAPSAAYTIVLDPGHGGDAVGAKGPNGIRESEVALSLALRVRRALARALPFARIAMTRERDVDLSLEARSALANALDADLFVSIHLNASPSPEDKGGVSTYVLDSTTDAAALRLAAQENGTDEAGVSALQLVLASLYRKDQVEHSRALAHDVQSSLLHSARKVYPELNDRGVKRALFYVLVGARMPAVLVEASFITRPEEARLLTTDGYRQAIADGIARGIERYVTRARAAAGRATRH